MIFKVGLFSLQADIQFLKIAFNVSFGLKAIEPWDHIIMVNNTGDDLNCSFIVLSKSKFLIRRNNITIWIHFGSYSGLMLCINVYNS